MKMLCFAAVSALLLMSFQSSAEPAFCAFKLTGPTSQSPVALTETSPENQLIGRIIAATSICNHDTSLPIFYVVSTYKYYGCSSESGAVVAFTGFTKSARREFVARGRRLQQTSPEVFKRLCNGINNCKIPATYSPTGEKIGCPAGIFDELDSRTR